MDSYVVFSSSSKRRDASRLDQDLKSIHRSGSVPLVQPSVVCTAGNGSPQPHIGVVGAGIAGLRCAEILLQHGFRVTVLEGRHRLGGRLHQERLSNGHMVDMGPNWIHGTKDNPIMDLMHETGTITSDISKDEQGRELAGAVFSETGSLLSQSEGTAVSTAMWDIVEKAFVHSNKHCSEIDKAESLYDFFLRVLPEHVPDGTPDCEARRAKILQMAAFWGAFVGSAVTTQSLKYFWLEECIEGENLFCSGTYSKVLQKLVEPVVQGAAIHYDQTVTRVVGKAEDGSGGSVSVTTASGDAFSFDELVFTAPLGWLKKNHASTFVPPLPPRLGQAIDSIGYGCLEKSYISFPEAFWASPDEKTGRSVRGFFQWLAPGVYAQPSNQQHWPQEGVDLSALPDGTAHPTLLFYTFGDQSRHITDTLARLPDAQEAAAFLAEYFRPYYAQLPHYDAAAPACQPVACLATNWLHDDLAGNGGYSNFQVGLEAGDEDVRVMREGLPGRGVWLAGEHTAPFVALGTATGAYWSGESVGRRIAEAYGKAEAKTKKAKE